MEHTPKPLPDLPLNGMEAAPKTVTATKLNALQNTMPPAAMEATKTVGAVSPNIMGNIVQTGLGVLSVVGAGVLMYAGMKSIVTGKSPLQHSKESLA